MRPDPQQDGVTHINIYSRGKTDVGRALSNFTYGPFTHPEFGAFVSVEGFWYWVGAEDGPERERLRNLFGPSAKMIGSSIPGIPMEEEDFRQLVREAMRCKIEQNPAIRRLFVESTLPFDHYYVCFERDFREPSGYRTWPVKKKKHQWQLDFLEQLRCEMQAE